MGQPVTTRLGLIADKFESWFFPGVFLFLACKDFYKLVVDWPRIHPALAQIKIFSPTTGDFVTVASVLMLVYLIILSLLSTFLLVRRSSAPKRTPDNWQEIVVPLLATFGVMANSFLIDLVPREYDRLLLPDSWRPTATIAGCLLVLGGLGMGIMAEWHLNTSFGVFVQVRDPVMTGLYRHVRHPMYASYFFVNCGICLLNPMLSYLILAILFLALLVYRARLEEAKLSDYSEEYREYKKRTPMIVPRLFSPSSSKS